MPFHGPFVGYLLRVMTPEEISELTTKINIERRPSLTALLEKTDKVDEFVENNRKSDKNNQIKMKEKALKLLTQKISTSTTNSLAEIPLPKTNPLIKQKIKKCGHSLKEIISFYKQNAEIKTKRDQQEKSEEIAHRGILINKKHF